MHSAGLEGGGAGGHDERGQPGGNDAYGSGGDAETVGPLVAATSEQGVALILVVTEEGQAPVNPEGVSEVVADKG